MSLERTMTKESRIVEQFCRHSRYGIEMDPQLSLADLCASTGMSRDEVLAAVRTLVSRSLIGARPPSPRSGGASDDDKTSYFATPATFVAFDADHMGWDPRADARELAAAVPAQRGQFLHIEPFIAQRGWSKRRANPAIALLLSQRQFKAEEAFLGDGLSCKALYRP
jgi:hypothetical protein